MSEKYCYTIGDEGQESLGLLEKCFNEQTEYFINKHGLSAGMRVLDIGCGLGYMTQKLARIVGEAGKVVAIDGSEKQINAAIKRTPGELKNIIEYKVHDIYELETLDQKFDLVYCRFVLHHLHKPRLALKKIAAALKPSGLYIGIEGIMNYAYSYPEHPAWLPPSFPFEVVEGEDRNGNIGKVLPALIQQAGMDCLEASIFQPLLIDKETRALLLQNHLDDKAQQIESGYATESEWQAQYDNLKACIEDTDTLIAFYAGNFTASRKVSP